MSKRWSQEELKLLEQICKDCLTRVEIIKKFRGTYPDRSYGAVSHQLKRHKEWVVYLNPEEPQTAKEVSRLIVEGLDLSPEELEKKLSRILKILLSGASTVTAISEDPIINVPKEAVWPLIDKLRERGYEVVEERRKVFLRRPWKDVKHGLPPLTKRNRVEALFMEGPSLGLKTQQGDLLATCLKIGEQREVFFSVILGNLVAGSPIKGREGEYFLTTADEQAEYVSSHFPRVSFNTFLLSGSRELSFSKKGESIEALICSKRDDIRLLKKEEGGAEELVVIPIGRNNAKVAIASHTAQAYTKSYPLQGIAENLQENVRYAFERSEPFRALIVGGLHSGILIPRQLPIHHERYNDFDMVAIPTLHRATASHVIGKRRGASPVLGCLILGSNFTEQGEFTGFTYAFYDLTAYFKDKDYLEDIEVSEALSPEAQKILSHLKKKSATRGALSRLIGRAIKKDQNNNNVPAEQPDTSLSVEEAIEELNAAGFKVIFDELRKVYRLLERRLRKEFKPLDLERLFQTTVKFVLTSDWHIGHKGERPDLIKKVFEIAESRKVDAIVCAGNVFEGAGSYEGQHQELLYHGSDTQKDRLLEILPKSKIPLILISSPIKEHDRVYYVRSGHDIVRQFVRDANMLGYRVVYLGGPHGTFSRNGITFDVQHPKGGLPYGQTYRIQRRIEMLVSTMEDLIAGPKATFIGHLHRAGFLLYKGMAGFLVPCLKDAPDDEYITALDKFAELGIWIVEFSFDQFKNLTKAELEYVPFETIHQEKRHIDLDQLYEEWGKEDNKQKKNKRVS